MQFYRYENYQTYDGTRIMERTFNLIRETPCGYWISEGGWNISGKHKWVSKTSRKRFAYPSKEEALTSFKARKHRQTEILRAQLSNAEYALDLADTIVVS